MTDILKKLKTYKKDEPEDVFVIIKELLQLCKEAADEIERLRKALRRIADLAPGYPPDLLDMVAQQARAALEGK